LFRDTETNYRIVINRKTEHLDAEIEKYSNVGGEDIGNGIGNK